MHKESRLSYHAVPKIMKNSHVQWELISLNGWYKLFIIYINMSIMKLTFLHLGSSEESKKRKIEDETMNEEQLSDNPEKDNSCIDMELWNKLESHSFWQPFEIYAKECRININVRQVLKLGEQSL